MTRRKSKKKLTYSTSGLNHQNSNSADEVNIRVEPENNNICRESQLPNRTSCGQNHCMKSGWWTQNSSTIQGITSIFSLIFLTAATILAYTTYRSSVDTAEKQLTAYMGLEDIELVVPNLQNKTSGPDGLVDGRTDDFVLLKLRNFGLTPALDVKCHLNWVWRPYRHQLEKDFNFPDNSQSELTDGAGFIVSKTTVFPQSSWSIPKPILDVTPFRSAISSQESLFLLGSINYTDIYQVPHTTQFCYSYQPNKTKRNEFIPYSRFNEVH